MSGAAEASLRRVRVGDVELAVDDRGRGPRPLVLVHGFMGFRQDFATQWDALSADGRVITPDLRGHGDSSPCGDPAAYTLDALAGDLIGLLEALDLPPVDLLGHSMGGMAVLRAALAAPRRVASLVLMDTSAEPLAMDRAAASLAAAVGREAGMEKLAEVMRRRAADDPRRSEADRRVEREWGAERFWAWRDGRIAAMDPEAFEPFALAMADQASLVPRLGEIAAPTLVLVGALDRDFLAPADALVAGLPDARLAVLPDAGHQPQHEAPAAWLAAVREHLSRVRGGA